MDIVGKQHEDRVGDRLKSPHTWTRETFPESSYLKLNPDVAAAVAPAARSLEGAGEGEVLGEQGQEGSAKSAACRVM